MDSTRDQVIIITGAAGFLGSAVTVNLAETHEIVAIDRREPNAALVDAAPSVLWRCLDIADGSALASVFEETRHRFGRIDFIVHLAAFYHFGSDWRSEYQRTNIDGTTSVLNEGIGNGVRRLIFASSMMAMLPPPPGQMLSEQTPATSSIPYGKSKAAGEKIIRQLSNTLPATVLRIGGVFSDWCELPPLYALIKLWAGWPPLNRFIVGRGETGFSFLHRQDLVRLVRCCVDRNEELGRYEVLLASQHGAVVHKDLFHAIQTTAAEKAHVRPIFISSNAARAGLYLRMALGVLVGHPPYERPWMLEYIDRPWVADTTYTRDRLHWECSKELGVCERLPGIVQRFKHQHRQWEHRNRERNAGRYAYQADQLSDGA